MVPGSQTGRDIIQSVVADLHSKILDARPPWGSKFFQFHAVFGKIWQNRMLVPPGELAPPPQGNPGSATGVVTALVELRELVFVFGKTPIHFQLDSVL